MNPVELIGLELVKWEMGGGEERKKSIPGKRHFLGKATGKKEHD